MLISMTHHASSHWSCLTSSLPSLQTVAYFACSGIPPHASMLSSFHSFVRTVDVLTSFRWRQLPLSSLSTSLPEMPYDRRTFAQQQNELVAMGWVLAAFIKVLLPVYIFSELKRIRLISYRRQDLGVSPGPFLTWRLEEIFVFTGYFDRLARRPGQSRSDRQQCLVPKRE